MGKERVKKSEKFWDKISNISKPPKKFEQAQVKTVEKTKKHLNSSDIVFDYGCGTGTITNAIAGNVKAIHAIDTSSGMIDSAKANASELKIENVNYEQSAIFDKRYKKESFNIVLAFNILQYLEDKHKVMQRINELLTPGGLFISETACLGERKTFLSILMFFVTKIGIVPKMKFFKISKLENLITNGNFKIVETENQSRLPEYFIVAKKI